MSLWELLFPKRCVECGAVGRYLCANCLNRVKVQDTQKCPSCCKPSVYGLTHSRCVKSFGMNGLVSVFEYGGVVKRMVGKIKYKYVKEMYVDLVELLVSMGEFEPLEKGSWVVVGVPLHKRRLRKRGFNQADLLAEKMADYFGWKYLSEILIRKTYTKPQVELSGEERLLNVRGKFLVNQKQLIKGKDVLLVDDVWTTGATMRECGKVLKRVGVKQVWGLVVAS